MTSVSHVIVSHATTHWYSKDFFTEQRYA